MGRARAGVIATALACPGLGLGALVVVPDPLAGDEGAAAGDARPVTEANRSAFDLAAVQVGSGVLNILDFEAAPQGDFLSLAASDLGVSGVSILPAGGSDGDDSSIRGNADYSVKNGYNTTLGGDLMMTLEEWGDGEPATGVVFRFDVPVLAFGACFTGVDTSAFGAVKVSFDNGTAREFSLDILDGGGAQFWGFVEDDYDAAVNEVTIRIEPEFNPDPEFGLFENQDVISLDDVRWVVIPEPGTTTLLVAALLGLLCRRRGAE